MRAKGYEGRKGGGWQYCPAEMMCARHSCFSDLPLLESSTAVQTAEQQALPGPQSQPTSPYPILTPKDT